MIPFVDRVGGPERSRISLGEPPAFFKHDGLRRFREASQRDGSRATIGYRAPLVRASALLDATPPASIARIAEELFCGVALLVRVLEPSAARTTHEAHCSSTSLDQGPAAHGPLRTGTPHRPPPLPGPDFRALPMGVRSPGTTSPAAADVRHGRKRRRDCSWSEYAGFAFRPKADPLPGTAS
jgi:hypothetical protein